MTVSYPYVDDGYSMAGEKIPDIPIIYLILRVGRFRASGPAIIDTGFDGGVYPNMEIIKMFEGLKPKATVLFENPIFGASEFEVYSAEAWVKNGAGEISLGGVKVYIPTEPELVTGEVLIGREVINGMFKSLTLSSSERKLTLEPIVNSLE
jgi:hypothetical protein